MAPFVFFLLLMGLLIFAHMVVSKKRMKKAITDVISSFRVEGALEPDQAISKSELNLEPQGTFKQIFKKKDYKPYALKLLVELDIVQINDEDKLYLSENRLDASKLKKYL